MPDVSVDVRWKGEGTEFVGGREGGSAILVDGDGAHGPSPMQALLLSLASCTAADLVEILGKMRVPLQTLRVTAAGDRAPEAPRRYTAIRLTYRVAGVAAEHSAKLDRALELSLEKYCSVLHSLRSDIELSTEIVRV